MKKKFFICIAFIFCSVSCLTIYINKNNSAGFLSEITASFPIDSVTLIGSKSKSGTAALGILSDSTNYQSIDIPNGTQTINAIYAESAEKFWIWCTGEYGCTEKTEDIESNLYEYTFDKLYGKFDYEQIVHMGTDPDMNTVSSIVKYGDDFFYLSKSKFAKYSLDANWAFDNKMCSFIAQIPNGEHIFLLVHNLDVENTPIGSTVYKISPNQPGSPFTYAELWSRKGLYISAMVLSKDETLILFDNSHNKVYTLKVN